MGFLIKLRKPERVQLNAEYWADVMPLLGDETDDARDAAMGGREGMAAAAKARRLDPEAESPFDRKIFNHELLRQAITAWNLDDDHGKIYPIDSASVALLPDAWRDRILLAMNERTKLPTPKEKSTNSVSA